VSPVRVLQSASTMVDTRVELLEITQQLINKQARSAKNKRSAGLVEAVWDCTRFMIRPNSK
jgi:hypothetical protein